MLIIVRTPTGLCFSLSILGMWVRKWPHGAVTPDLAWAIPPDVECVLGQWRGAARSHAGRPCLPKLPQRAWPEGFCQHRYQSYSLPVSLSLFLPLFLSLTLSFTLFPFCLSLYGILCFCFLYTFYFSLAQISSFPLPALSFSVAHSTHLQLIGIYTR